MKPARAFLPRRDNLARRRTDTSANDLSKIDRTAHTRQQPRTQRPQMSALFAEEVDEDATEHLTVDERDG